MFDIIPILALEKIFLTCDQQVMKYKSSFSRDFTPATIRIGQVS